MTNVIPFMRRFREALMGTFSGRRSIYEVYGWKKDPQYEDFLDKYYHQDIAKRIIDAPVLALWSDPPNLVADDQFKTAWEGLLKTIPVFANITRLDILSGIGTFAVMVIGFDDGRSLDQPVRKTTGRRVIYMQPYGEDSVKVKSFIKDPTDARFGLPEMYTISRIRPDKAVGVLAADVSTAFDVHWTRVLHVAEGALESRVYGRSRLEPVYNVLDDIQKVTGGSAETFWLTANRGLHIDVDKEMELDAQDEANLSEELEEYQHELRRVIRTRGVKINALGSEVADPRGVFDVQLSLLSANTGLPKRVITGSEAGQLASQQDRANWAQVVEQRVKSYGEPIVMLPLLKTLIDAGVLPEPTQLRVNWPDAFKMNPLERAQTSAQIARSATNIANTLKTIEEINQSMAEAALPTEEPVGGGGGFFGNADPKVKPEPKEGGAVQTIKKPPLMPKRPPIELISVQEARNIIGFGRQAPVFDAEETATPAAVSDPEVK